jgi:predicted RNase H-like HicB family nuclease
MNMKMDIYGFKAKVTRDGKYFIGEIPELHVQDQAKSLRELENELKDAVDTAVEFLLEKNHQKELKSPVLKSLIAKN